jgi:hypothetical protein
MMPRILAVTVGLIAGLAAFLILALDWQAVLAAVGVDRPGMAAAQASDLPRLTWAICGGVTLFAVAALAVVLVIGLAETSAARRAINALRHDPALADSWNLADWRAAFARTAIADRAEAMIAAINPPGSVRRVAVDTQLLVGLDEVWLDRLTLKRTVAPLAFLVVGLGAAAALFTYVDGDPWAAVLAAGMSGWVIIYAAQYLARMALSPAVTAAVDAATAAIRPLTAFQAVEGGPAPAPAVQPDLPAAVAEAIAAPVSRLADAADRLAASAKQPSREQTIEAALADIRAGIERLLEVSDPPD